MNISRHSENAHGKWSAEVPIHLPEYDTEN